MIELVELLQLHCCDGAQTCHFWNCRENAAATIIVIDLSNAPHDDAFVADGAPGAVGDEPDVSMGVGPEAAAAAAALPLSLTGICRPREAP